jgi:hypothetical protein
VVGALGALGHVHRSRAAAWPPPNRSNDHRSDGEGAGDSIRFNTVAGPSPTQVPWVHMLSEGIRAVVGLLPRGRFPHGNEGTDCR